MIIAFAFIDGAGIPTGGGSNRSLPDGAVVLPPPFTTLDLPRLQYRDGVWVERVMPAPEPPTEAQIAERAAAMLDQARVAAVDRINARVGAIRKRIYTDIPGQDALYLEKRAEAVAYVAAVARGAEPATLRDYPLLDNEVGITAPAAWQLAQVWLNRSDQFKRVGAATEKARIQATIAISTAPDFETIETIQRTFNEALNGLSI